MKRKDTEAIVSTDDEITADELDEITDLGLDLDLDPYDLNRAVLVAEWGTNSFDWLATQHAMDATPAEERARLLQPAESATTQLAPVLPFNSSRRSAFEEQRAA